MPLFEYVCNDCGTEFEKIVPTSTTGVECKSCQSVKVEKQLSVFAVAGGSSEAMPEACGSGGCQAPAPGMCGMMN
jgi:putative FmdB family regulatory protein